MFLLVCCNTTGDHRAHVGMHINVLLTCTNVNSLQLRVFPTEGREVTASRHRTPSPRIPQDRNRSDLHTCSSTHEFSTPDFT